MVSIVVGLQSTCLIASETFESLSQGNHQTSFCGTYIVMAPSLAPDIITLAEFEEVLSCYDAQSMSKPSNKGGETLAQLDIYQLLTIPV